MCMWTTPTPEPRGAGGRDAGFTLVEIMVALILASIFATIIFQLIRGQGRFVEVQSARQEVQQNARAAVEVIGSELRGATAQGLLRGEDGAIEYMAPRFFGLTCPNGTSTQVDVIAPTVDASALTVASSTGLMVDTSTIPTTRGYAPATGARASVTAMAQVALNTSNCAGMNPAGTTSVYRLTGTNFPLVVAGRSVFTYDIVRYDVANDDSGLPWVRRGNTVAGGQQPFVGPLESSTALRFRYFAANSNTPMPTAPGTNVTNLRLVSRVRVVIAARSKGPTSATRQIERDSVTILLRNR